MMETKIELRVGGDIVAARQMGREMARVLGFGTADQTRLATAISELTRNALQHAGSGVCVIADESNRETAVIRVTVEDRGPGIPDIEKALADGFSTSHGLGAGLPGTKRLVHDFSIESRPGNTKIDISMRRKIL